MWNRLRKWLSCWRDAAPQKAFAEALDDVRRSAGPRRDDARLSRVTARGRARFPHTAMRIEAEDIVRALRDTDIPALKSALAAADLSQQGTSSAWSEAGNAAVVGVVIESLLSEASAVARPRGWFRRRPGNFGARDMLVDRAFKVFHEYRRHTREPVPEAHELIAEVARLRRADSAAVRAFVEYVVLDDAGDSRKSAPASGARRDVLEALQAACSPSNPSAEEFNLLVDEVCGFPWAALNLMEIHYRRQEFARAREFLDKVCGYGRFPDDPELEFRAGRICRECGDWDGAARWFGRSRRNHPPLAAPLGRLVRVLEIEAGFRIEDRGLAAGVNGHAPASHERWRDELTALLDASLPGDSASAPALQLLAEIGSRVEPPRHTLRRLALRFDRADVEIDLHAGVSDLLAHTAHPVLGDHFPLVAAPTPQPSLLVWGSWMLEHGQLSRFDDRIGHPHGFAGPSPRLVTPELVVLYGESLLRRGIPAPGKAAVQALASANRPDLLQRLHAAQALAQHSAPGLETLLNSARARLLSWPQQETCRAEALALRGDWGGAADRFLQILGHEPDSIAVRHRFALRAVEFGQDELALRLFEAVVAASPEHYAASLGAAALSPQWKDMSAQLLRVEPQLRVLVDVWRTRLSNVGRLDLSDRLAEILAHIGQLDAMIQLSGLDSDEPPLRRDDDDPLGWRSYS